MNKCNKNQFRQLLTTFLLMKTTFLMMKTFKTDENKKNVMETTFSSDENQNLLWEPLWTTLDHFGQSWTTFDFDENPFLK